MMFVQILNNFQQLNRALTGSVAKWIAKNQKKLKPVIERSNLEKINLHKEYVSLKGTEKLFWNYKEGSPKAVTNAAGDMLFNEATMEPIPATELEGYKFFVDGEGRKAEYDEKMKAVLEAKYPIQICQLEQGLLGNVNIPAQADLVALYDILTYDENAEQEEELKPTDGADNKN